MEANPVQIKTELTQTHRNHSFVLSMDASSGAHQLSVVYNTISDGTNLQPGLNSVPQFQSDAQRVDGKVLFVDQKGSLPNSIKSEYYPSDTGPQKVNNTVLDPLLNLTRSTGVNNEMIKNNTFHVDFNNLNESGPEIVDSNDVNQIKPTSLVTPKPSEALFVRALIGRCKRIAPLWFRGVSSMRERNREENRRMASNSGQSQNDWSLIGLKIAEMNAASETDAVANLLKKLYKELPTDSVFWFLKCWLGSEDSLNDPDSCVISRGDAKGRMRRIDGGKGSDKVWRLDTIVGMLYHGLPMSSTDTNIMVHTCDQELCVRPQHIRFRASSVALVVVLKALAQAGYTVIPPPVAAGPNGVAPNASDESVDVFGPFTIEELQKYRSENLNPAEDSISKLTLNSSDRDFADTVPVIRGALQGIRMGDTQPIIPTSNPSVISQMNGYHPLGSRVKMEPADLAYHRQLHPSNTAHPNLGPIPTDPHSPRLSIQASVADNTITTTCSPNSSQPSRSTVASIGSTISNTTTTTVGQKHPSSSLDELTTNGMPNSPSSVCLPVASCVGGHRFESRRSLKRPAPSDSPCSFPSSPIRMSQHNHHHHQLVPPPPSSSPPLLISDMANSISLSHHHHHPPHGHPSMPHRQLSSDSILQAPVRLPSSTMLPCFAQTTNETASLSRCNPLLTNSTDSNCPFSVNLGSEHPRPAQDARTAVSHSTASGPTIVMLHQPLALPMNHHLLAQPIASGGSTAFTTTTPSNAASFAVSATCSGGGGGGSSSSGKTTPRQPAKKRLEARTPTIEGVLDETAAGGSRSTPLAGTGSDDSNSAVMSNGAAGAGLTTFRVHQNTPFVPVQSRSGRPSSGGSASSGSLIPNVTITSSNESGTGVSLLPAPNRHMPDSAEESEMDQELVDIMVRRHSGSTAGCCPTDGSGSGAETSSGAMHSEGTVRHHSLVYPPGFSIHPELGTSPTRRRIIEALVASWTASHGSPLQGNSTPINPRRSASACSLPRVGASPNDDLTEFFASPTGPHGSTWYPLHNNSGQKSLWLREESNAVALMMTGRKSASLTQRGNATPPPTTVGGELRLLSGTRALGQSTLHTPTLNGDGMAALDSSSVQELESLIRNSPTSGELIDMLVNMAQQYGVQQPRAGSSASRPSSQVAQRFYRSLVNGSVCGSPFLVSSLGGPSTTTTTGGTTTNAQTLSGSGSSMNSTTGTANQLFSPTASGGQHHLRGLSFTPLAVDAELGYSSTHTEAVSSPVKLPCVVEATSITVTNNMPSSTTTTTTGTTDNSSMANPVGNCFFSYRRPLKQ